jgi:hypothetical protein
MMDVLVLYLVTGELRKSIATYEALIWKIFSVDSRVFLKYMTPL